MRRWLLRGAAVLVAASLVAPAQAATASTPSDEPDSTSSATTTPEPSPTPTDTPSPAPTESVSPTMPAAPDDVVDESSDGSVDAAAEPIAAPLAAAIPTASRVSGADRYATSVAASQATFPSGADAAIVVAGSASVDAIIGSAMAARLGAPVLYVYAASVPAAVTTELSRLGLDRIVVVGGTGVVADSVLTTLRRFAPSVTRFGGIDRYATSRAALEGGTRSDTVYVAGGASLNDAPLASVTAAATGRGVVLVNGVSTAADAATIASLRKVGARSLVIVGSPTAVSTAMEQSLRSAGFGVTRRTAADPYQLAVVMTADRTSGASRAIMANPQTIADVAVASAIAAATRQPLYYAIEFCTPDAVSTHLQSAGTPITGVGGDYWLDDTALANSPCSVERTTRQNALNAAIRSTMSAYTGSFTVTVRELGPFREIGMVNGGARLEVASMMKIFAAWAALKRIEQGRATMNTVLPSGVTLGACMKVMIHASDNYCHSDIVHWIGIGTINTMIRDAGFTNTFYGSVPSGSSVLYAGNRSSTNDLAWMMERLANASILAKPQADHLISLMKSQIWRGRIASGIPPGVVQASKPGSLWIASGLLQADTAIVYGPKYTYAISIIGDNGPPQAALRAISRTVYQHFHGTFGAAASYPVQQMATKKPSGLRTSPGGPIAVTVGANVAIEVIDAMRESYLIRYGGRQLWLYHTALRNR